MSEAQKYELYVDLDGVIVNFADHAKLITGIDINKAGKEDRNKFWKHIGRYVKQGNPFFAAMSPMEDAFHLWNYVLKYKPTILSATGHIFGAGNEKRAWVRDHLGSTAADNAIFVRNSRDKAKYASPTSILIDDRTKSIAPWVEAGGIGILHKTAELTIRELMEYGL